MIEKARMVIESVKTVETRAREGHAAQTSYMSVATCANDRRHQLGYRKVSRGIRARGIVKL